MQVRLHRKDVEKTALRVVVHSQALLRRDLDLLQRPLLAQRDIAVHCDDAAEAVIRCPSPRRGRIDETDAHHHADALLRALGDGHLDEADGRLIDLDNRRARLVLGLREVDDHLATTAAGRVSVHLGGVIELEDAIGLHHHLDAIVQDRGVNRLDVRPHCAMCVRSARTQQR